MIFIEFIEDNLLTQLVIQPTLGNLILDLVIIDDPDRIFNINHGPPLGNTAKNKLHCTLTWDFYLREPRINKLKNKSKQVYSKGNF